VDHAAVVVPRLGTAARIQRPGPNPRRPGRRRVGAVLVVGAALAASAGCGSAALADRGPSAGSAPTASVVPTPTPAPPPLAVWPLTGRETDASVDRPALAVKIENSAAARPQSGLNAADIVWEEVVEGGITRYVAVYHSDLPSEIGPVRSIRPMDAAIAAPLGGLFAFSGGLPSFVSAVDDAGLQVLSHDAGAAGFYRVGTRRAPHNVYADPRRFLDQADQEHQAAPLAQFDFATAGEQPTAIAAGTPAAAVQLKLSGSSRPEWTWSQADLAWLRAEGGTPAMSADGGRLRATNVVVLRVDIVNTGYHDPAGNPVPETRLVGGGEALVATGGHAVAGAWSKLALSAPVILTGPLSSPVRLAPGTTWVELVPTGTGAVAVR
jgi:hypothetical protein